MLYDELVIATRNKGKLKEFGTLLHKCFKKISYLGDFKDIPEIEETGKTFKENATIKANRISEITGICTLADDSGLIVDALNGEPGVYSARYAGNNATDSDNNKKLLKTLKGVKNRTARFECCLILVLKNGDIIEANGICEGVILDEEKGGNGFGYDPLFYLPELKKTMAELTIEEKNIISHRANAIRDLLSRLAD